jgi:mRNA-degrading endonuclease HigB of HigAB toxin-antitoxin module
MTDRTFTGKNGDVWTWEETPETIEALKQLHNAVNETNLKRPNEYKATDS